MNLYLWLWLEYCMRAAWSRFWELFRKSKESPPIPIYTHTPCTSLLNWYVCCLCSWTQNWLHGRAANWNEGGEKGLWGETTRCTWWEGDAGPGEAADDCGEARTGKQSLLSEWGGPSRAETWADELGMQYSRPETVFSSKSSVPFWGEVTLEGGETMRGSPGQRIGGCPQEALSHFC